MTHQITQRPHQLGTTMIEVLVSMVISVIGLLGLAGFQLRAYASETESFQRAQASVLLDDMVNRVMANRGNAGNYVANDIGVGAIQTCSPTAVRATIDMCQWGNLLRGAAEKLQNSNIGAMTSARGCITQTAPKSFVVAIVWQGTAPTGAPPTACGKDQYSEEAMRRAVTVVVSLADLG